MEELKLNSMPKINKQLTRQFHSVKQMPVLGVHKKQDESGKVLRTPAKKPKKVKSKSVNEPSRLKINNSTINQMKSFNISLNLVKLVHKKQFLETIKNLEANRKQHYASYGTPMYDPCLNYESLENTNHKFMIDLDSTPCFITENYQYNDISDINAR